MNMKALVAEFFGTMALIIAGVGVIVNGNGNLVSVALAHGLTVAAFAFAFGHLSGTHINPAVTLGAVVAGKMKIGVAVGYWVAQLLGALAGAALLAYIIGDISAGNTVGSLSGNYLLSTLAELVMTFFFFTVIYQTSMAGKTQNMAGLAIGVILAVMILWGGPYTGASLNPARTLGPAIVSGQMGAVTAGIVGPLIGATVAALLNRAVLTE